MNARLHALLEGRRIEAHPFPSHASLGLSLTASDRAAHTARIRITRVQ